MIPLLRQAGSKDKRIQAGRTNAEHPFRNDTAIQTAFGRQMALVAFRPCLDCIRDMFTQQTLGRIESQIIGSLLRLTASIHATQRIQGGAILECFTSGLRQQNRSPSTGAERTTPWMVASFRSCIPDRERNADPRTQDIISFIIFIGIKSFDGPAEIAVDIFFLQGCSLASIGSKPAYLNPSLNNLLRSKHHNIRKKYKDLLSLLGNGFPVHPHRKPQHHSCSNCADNIPSTIRSMATTFRLLPYLLWTKA